MTLALSIKSCETFDWEVSSKGKWVQCRIYLLVGMVVKFGESCIQPRSCELLFPCSAAGAVMFLLKQPLRCVWSAGSSCSDQLCSFLRDLLRFLVSYNRLWSVVSNGFSVEINSELAHCLTLANSIPLILIFFLSFQTSLLSPFQGYQGRQTFLLSQIQILSELALLIFRPLL